MLDHGTLSPSGHVSKRTERRTKQAARDELVAYLAALPSVPPEDRRLRLLRQAAELRTLAARGMKPRAHAKRAAELEAEAHAMEKPK